MEDFFRRRSRVDAAQQPQAGDAARHAPSCSTTRSAPPAASRSTSARPLLLHARACRASCAACWRSRSSRGCWREAALQTAIHLKRFHSYGIGESHADTLLDGRGGARARRQREARLPRALPAARDQAHGARHRHGRHPPQARAGRGGGAQAARQLHPGRGRSDARRRGAGGAGRRARARWRSSRRSPAGRSPRASRTCRARRRCSAAASWRAISARSAPPSA